MNFQHWWHLTALAVPTAAALTLVPAAVRAQAEGNGYVVEDAGIDDLDECGVETWASFARNRDFKGTISPTCTVNLGHPVELGAEVERSHSDREWKTALKFKTITTLVDGHRAELGAEVERSRSDRQWKTEFKLNTKAALVPFENRPFGLALIGEVAFDLTTRQTSEWKITLPLSIQLAAPLLVNLNVGGRWEPMKKRSFVTWGAGFELSIAKPFKLIGEAFAEDSPKPGAQIGVRYMPAEKIDFDLIYGRNLKGENANWITVGVNLRF